MMRLAALVVVVAVLAAVAEPAGRAGAATPALVRLDGIGPLKLGMRRSQALATGWLADRGSGCPLGGRPPITYGLTGPDAPPGVRGIAEFGSHRLRTLSFTRGVRTVHGVTVGRTTAARMVARYRKAGYAGSAELVGTLGGTIVTVKRRGRFVIGAFAAPTTIEALAIPSLSICE